MSNQFDGGPLKLRHNQAVYIVQGDEVVKMHLFSVVNERYALKPNGADPQTAAQYHFADPKEIHLSPKAALRNIKTSLEAQMKELQERHFAVSEKLASAIMKDIREDSASPTP
ncbi:hypothetical protein V0M98_38095 (plasmid) [Pseudomonas silesiensis]|uniref:hypothetical protein n=1 Tax=Pseudomonas silesiensis TaxID=1853130 RepID=UPI0030D3E98C